jgi:prepilin-type N-terminal cleavage/methylation domain-containing protein
MRYKLNDRGDTILEVLLAIAIIGLVLAGAYSTANLSSQNELAAQEHEIATTIAESQLEELNNLSTVNLAAINSASEACFSTTQVLITSAGTYNSNCKNYDSSVYPELYTVDIQRTIAGNANPNAHMPLSTYEVTVDWDGPVPNIQGGVQIPDSVQMFYQPEGGN